MTRLRKLALMSASAVSIYAAPLQADIASDLSDFWTKSGGGVNSSRPMTYDGQRAGYATLGSVQVRTRSRSSELYNIQLPSVRAGCGGIDIFGGSFSFISAEELIALMEAIMQNAAGFAFELALESMSPAVQETVAKLRDLVQQVNAMNVSSCEAGQMLASSLWPAMDGASQHVCETIGSYQGLFADRLAAKHGCGTGGQRKATLSAANAELQEQVPTNVNYAWRAIKKNAFLSSDPALAEFFMTLTGTIITLEPASETEGPRQNPIAPRAASSEMIEALVGGGTVQILRCDEHSDCLEPVSQDVTIADSSALIAKTRATILGIKDAIEDGNAQIPDEAVALLGMTSVPVLDMLVTGMSYQHIFVQSEIDAMAEVVAVDLAMIYIDRALQEMSASASRVATFGALPLEYQKQIQATLSSLGKERMLAAERYSAAMRTLERLNLAKTELAAYSSSRFTAMLEAN